MTMPLTFSPVNPSRGTVVSRSGGVLIFSGGEVLRARPKPGPEARATQTPRPPRTREKMKMARAMIAKMMRIVHNMGAPEIGGRQDCLPLSQCPSESGFKRGART